MGALKGAVTVRRYLVHGDPPKDRGRIVKGVRAHALTPIDPASDVVKTYGWAWIEDPAPLDLASDKIFFADAVALAVRVDSLRPPAQVVKRLVAERLAALGRRPNRAEKQATKDEILRKLRGRYYPVTRTVDMVWRMDAGRVYFWSHAKGMNEQLIDLFARSFSLELVPLGPGLVAGKGALPAGLTPCPEMTVGFPGLPGRPVAGEDGEGIDA